MSVNSGGPPPPIGPTGAITGLGAKIHENIEDFMQDVEMQKKNELTHGNTQKINLDNTATGNSVSNNIQQQRIPFYYNKTDSGPYTVHIENITPDFKGILSAIKIGEIILKNHPDIDNKIKQIEKIGRNRVQIIIKDFQSANNLAKSPLFKNYSLEAYIPKYNLHRQGVIYGIDDHLEEDELKNKIAAFDMHCVFTVESVKRLLKKVYNEKEKNYKLIKSKCVLVTFRSQFLPKYIAINHVVREVVPYVQKVVLCDNCWRYGHLGKQCKAKIRCLKCFENHKLEISDKDKDPCCIYCKGKHFSNQLSKCPEFKRQKQIKEFMSHKNVSFKDAEKNVPKISYASVLASQPEIDLQDLDNMLNSSQSTSQQTQSQRTPSRFTVVKSPIKRLRPASPRPEITEHNQILSQFRLSQTNSNLLSDPVYQTSIQENFSLNNMSQNKPNSINENLIIDLVVSIINNLKENKLFDIQKRELIDLIKTKLQVNK